MSLMEVLPGLKTYYSVMQSKQYGTSIKTDV